MVKKKINKDDDDSQEIANKRKRGLGILILTMQGTEYVTS